MIYFIPARKGSKTVINKNTRLVLGQPLIAWTFESVKSKSDNVFVSSDSNEVLELAKKYSFHTLKRNARLCQDNTTMSDVLFDFAEKIAKQRSPREEVMVLYPTSIMRRERHIEEAQSLWQKKGANHSSLMSVTPVYHRPYGLMKIGKNGRLRLNLSTGMKYYRKQDIPIVYRANGAIYIIPLQLMLDRKINSQLFTYKT